jgi:uncharacterized membrane protein YcaP (DUF421 family)
MLFDSWFALLRIFLVGVLAYAGLVALLRISGKRTLAKMNAFDLVITVALGSSLATVLLSKDIALVEGLFAFALLCTLQFAMSFAAVRSRRFRQAIKSEPALLFRRGQYLRSAMRRERVSRDEIRAAIRAAGMLDVNAVQAVVLETDGTMSVLNGGGETPVTALEGVRVQP